MKIDPTNSQTPFPLNTAKSVDKTDQSKTINIGKAQTEGAKTNSGDLERIKSTVKRLMAQSSVRPEMIAGRTPNQPAKPISDVALRNFISALSQTDNNEP